MSVPSEFDFNKILAKNMAAKNSWTVKGTQFAKKYWKYIVGAIVLVIALCFVVPAMTSSKSAFASVGGNESEDTAYWEQTHHGYPAAPYDTAPPEPAETM